MIERLCLEILRNSEVIKRIQIVSGMKKGKFTAGMNGKYLRTVIYKD